MAKITVNLLRHGDGVWEVNLAGQHYLGESLAAAFRTFGVDFEEDIRHERTMTRDKWDKSAFPWLDELRRIREELEAAQ